MMLFFMIPVSFVLIVLGYTFDWPQFAAGFFTATLLLWVATEVKSLFRYYKYGED